MEFTADQIAELLGGRVEGDGTVRVRRLAKIEDAGPGELAFLANLKYEHFLYETKAAVVIVADTLPLREAVRTTLIRVADPYSGFTELLEQYQRLARAGRTGVEEPSYLGAGTTIGEGHYRAAFSYIGQNCRIGRDVQLHPHASVGDDCVIGDGTILYSGVKVYPGTVIGARCVLHAGCVIGSDGFGFAPQPDGSYRAIPQTGNVVLEDDVSIGANTTVDCATLSSTIIRQGAKIDNLVMIAHNVEVGAHTVIAAQSGVSGSTKVGEFCTLAGQVGLVGHITIAPRTIIGAQSGVSKSVKEPGTFIQGSPAFDYKQNLRAAAIFRRLPDLQRQLDELRAKRASE
ncbi:MAG: UDP-3-O-(3-hydroxymyristoyl)glucosamine N-acyltransferase [Hymenobacteraceae bacterium]|nr:UDP-3-O-(3-hydroxymyristoyl)glucosamine N-acyltransferase [Hymenobacteraceae bacterium]